MRASPRRMRKETGRLCIPELKKERGGSSFVFAQNYREKEKKQRNLLQRAVNRGKGGEKRGETYILYSIRISLLEGEERGGGKVFR